MLIDIEEWKCVIAGNAYPLSHCGSYSDEATHAYLTMCKFGAFVKLVSGFFFSYYQWTPGAVSWLAMLIKVLSIIPPTWSFYVFECIHFCLPRKYEITLQFASLLCSVTFCYPGTDFPNPVFKLFQCLLRFSLFKQAYDRNIFPNCYQSFINKQHTWHSPFGTLPL